MLLLRRLPGLAAAGVFCSGAQYGVSRQISLAQGPGENPEWRACRVQSGRRRGTAKLGRIMFITRKHIKGSNDRGAWPWRRPHDFA
jgi:hypothetical protein